MKYIILLLLCGCADPQGFYPGDARNDLPQGELTCSNGRNTFSGDTITGQILGCPYTATIVQYTGIDVFYRVNPTSCGDTEVLFGELIFTPSVNAFTTTRIAYKTLSVQEMNIEFNVNCN